MACRGGPKLISDAFTTRAHDRLGRGGRSRGTLAERGGISAARGPRRRLDPLARRPAAIPAGGGPEVAWGERRDRRRHLRGPLHRRRLRPAGRLRHRPLRARRARRPNAEAGRRDPRAVGAHAVCYVSAGTAEKFRPDYRQYLQVQQEASAGRLIGEPFSDRFSERRTGSNIGPEKHRKFVLDAASPSGRSSAPRPASTASSTTTSSAYAQSRRNTGFRVKPSEQLAFNEALAEDRPLERPGGRPQERPGPAGASWSRASTSRSTSSASSTGSARTTPARLPLPSFDAGKAVFHVEYRQRPEEFCDEANALGVSAIKKSGDFSLGARPWTPCR